MTPNTDKEAPKAPTDTDLHGKVAAILTEKPSTMIRSIAKDFGVTEGDIVALLPESMRLYIPVTEFATVWEIMTKWEKITFLAETPGAILEISCTLPKGTMGHGMYNLMDKTLPLGGHIFMESIASICLISKPAFGMESHSVQFFTADGQPCFSVYLGRAADRSLIPSVKQGYLDLWNTYAEKLLTEHA